MSPQPPPDHLINADPYPSVDSPAARAVLEQHYDVGADLYKFWGSPGSVARALLLGWARSRHPAHRTTPGIRDGRPARRGDSRDYAAAIALLI
jgi:hypothetical protein